ncbi:MULTISPECIES: hypothetical protein [unclassified Schaalia]|uniref:hypothetical protein n=1 Tax=unclassified Schaalia TaxID=2691889 RepID=UPI001E4D54F7|nr:MULTISPECIES: hypothetical protein [unclassified Schaalia]MCD4549080.1 hypothetical protein [Schaalia sp. lx-260]MCD4557268.1 hypothetical protein [Schaalia sp. lx-100]
MRGKRFITACMSVVCSCGLFIASGAAYAASDDDVKIDEIIRLNPYELTREEVRTHLEEYSQETGKTQSELLDQALMELREQHALAVESGNQGSSFRSAGPGLVYLPTSYNKGDIYYTDAGSSGANWGHVGLYCDKRWLVEASGIGKKSDWKWHYDLQVLRGTLLLEVKTNQVKRNIAADYAYNNLRDYPYNMVFWANKSLKPDKLNCSQLVWLAYYKSVGIDLDGNGGPGVYPRDIRDSPLTAVNWIVNS